MIGRVILPGLLLAGGVSMLIYGAAERRLPVWEEALVKEKVMEEQEIEVPITVPEPFPGGDPFLKGPDGVPGPIAPPFPNKVKEKVLVTVVKSRQTEQVVDEPEYDVIREITFGGIKLAASDKLMRTYRRPEAGWDEADLPPPPSLCPT